MHAQQLYLHVPGGDNLTGTLSTRVFDPVCILGHKYYLEAYPGVYFVVRNDQWCDSEDCQRVCLYREGAVNVYLRGNSDPYTALVSNELRCGRSIQQVHADMVEKAEGLTVKFPNTKKLS